MNLVWYFDVISPFAHLALHDVLRLAEGQHIELRPVLFAGILGHWGQLGPAEIQPKRLHTYRLVQFEAERTGIKLRFPPRHPFRSLEVMRLLTALHGRHDAVREAFAFIWGEGRDPSEPEEFAALAGRLNIADPEALVAEAGAKEALRTATDLAAARGVFGVPTLAIGEELFWGADAMPLARAVLADPGLLRRGEMARVGDLPKGAERRRLT